MIVVQVRPLAFWFLDIGERLPIVKRFAASLHARGLTPGTQVAVMIPNVPEFTMAYYGILYAGCSVVPPHGVIPPGASEAKHSASF